jgi:hypothetical protein
LEEANHDGKAGEHRRESPAGAGAALARAREQVGLRAHDEHDDYRCGQTLDHADGEVNRLHERQEGGERQSRDAGGGGLEHHGESAKLQADDGGDHAAGGHAAARRHGCRTDDPAVHERIGDEGRKEAQVEDVGAEGEKAAIGEEERLNGEDRRHDEECRLGPEQDGEKESPTNVAA